MTVVFSGQRLVLAASLGLALFAVVAHGCLLAGLAVSPWLLPMALLAGAIAARRPPVASADDAPRALRWVVVLMLLFVLAAVTYGALATPSRHWDGAVAWDTTARCLADQLSLEQPYFRDAAVFAHSRDYPLLQPLLMASLERLVGAPGGRLVFPAILALFALSVGVAAARATRHSALAWLLSLAAGTTPALVSPTNGGIDSGYGDALLLLCTTTMAAGLLVADWRWLASGALLAVMSKPEGLVYAGAAALVAFCMQERRLLMAAAGGWLLGAGLWLPLQRELQQPGMAIDRWAVPGAVLTVAVAIVIAEGVARWFGWRARGRIAAVVAVLAVLLLALPFLPSASSGAHGAMAAYLGRLGTWPQQLPRLWESLLGTVRFGLLRGGFTLAFWLPLLGLPWLPRLSAQGRGLCAFLLLGVLIVQVPFVLSPVADLQQPLRSSMPRLLLHWLGAALLLGGVLLAAGSRRSAEAEAHGERAA